MSTIKTIATPAGSTCARALFRLNHTALPKAVHTFQPSLKEIHMRNSYRLFTALASAVFSAGVLAQAALPLVDGEVRKVDLSAQKITLKHGEIKNLDMPAMSMVFKVKAPALLYKVKAGDRVQFTAEDVNGALTVVTLERIAP